MSASMHEPEDSNIRTKVHNYMNENPPNIHGERIRTQYLSVIENAPKSKCEGKSKFLNTFLQRLHHGESFIRVLELVGSIMDKFSMEGFNINCCEFMLSIKDIQKTQGEKIKSACEYRPFQMCNYSSRISSEICCKKLEYVLEQLDNLKQSVEQYNDAALYCKFIRRKSLI